jgi:hypothetical protein
MVVKAVQKFVHMHTSGVLNTELDQICRFLIKFVFLFTVDILQKFTRLVKLRVNENFYYIRTHLVCGLIALKS